MAFKPLSFNSTNSMIFSISNFIIAQFIGENIPEIFATSSKEIMEDIQKILDNTKTETEAAISKNKEILLKLVEKLVKDILMNSDGLVKFFNENPLNTDHRLKT